MTDVQTLEQRFEGISVQDENYDRDAPVAQHKPNVHLQQLHNHCARLLTIYV